MLLERLLAQGRTRDALRFATGYYVTNGLVGALGLLLISSAVQAWFGPLAASAASVGVIVCIPPDQAAPRRGKLLQLLPAAVIGPPLFYAVQLLHDRPFALGLLLVPATFAAFLAGAWGKRGLPIVMSGMFAMIFSMAAPRAAGAQSAVHDVALQSTLYFSLGALLYLTWATLANAALNGRYRAQMLAETLLRLAGLMRTESQQVAGASPDRSSVLLRRQAALADQLQTTRNVVLESPRTPRRRRLAAMLVRALEIRDDLLACELDLDALKAHPERAELGGLQDVLQALAEAMERLADALLFRRPPPPFDSRRPQLEALRWSGDSDAGAVPGADAARGTDAARRAEGVPEVDAATGADGVRGSEAVPGAAGVRGSEEVPSTATLARGLAGRLGHVNDEVVQLFALARGEAAPELAAVRTAWRMFVTPTGWSMQPFLELWRWHAPPLRHAVRAALAVATAYALSVVLPWGTHDYWILLTIAVVLRGSFAQTLERRNARVAGTLLGCLLAGALLSAHTAAWVLLIIVTLAQATAHAFAFTRYLVTAVAATVLGLLQAHMLHAGSSPVFDVVERLADTVLGGTIAWVFSYVMPSWERREIPHLVERVLAAQARHATLALRLGGDPRAAPRQTPAPEAEPASDIEWRLARREAYDSLSALVQSTQRSLAEPPAVRPPLDALERLLAHAYQLLAQLAAVKTMLLLRREHLNFDIVAAPLARAASVIDTALTRPAGGSARALHFIATGQEGLTLPDPFEKDITPWMLRRLRLAARIAAVMREDADEVLTVRAGALDGRGASAERGF